MNSEAPYVSSSAFRELANRTRLSQQYSMIMIAGMGMLLNADRSQIQSVIAKEVLDANLVDAASITTAYDHIHRMIEEEMITRAVDNFELYLASMLRRIFNEVPESLSSSKTATYKQILEFDTRSDFIAWAADRQVHELGYAGLRGIVEHFNKNKWAQVDIDDEAGGKATEVIEVRNVIVHAGGIISGIFLSRTKRNDLKVGDAFPIDMKYLEDGLVALAEIARRFDKAVLAHFKLPPIPNA